MRGCCRPLVIDLPTCQSTRGHRQLASKMRRSVSARVCSDSCRATSVRILRSIYSGTPAACLTPMCHAKLRSGRYACLHPLRHTIDFMPETTAEARDSSQQHGHAMRHAAGVHEEGAAPRLPQLCPPCSSTVSASISSSAASVGSTASSVRSTQASAMLRLSPYRVIAAESTAIQSRMVPDSTLPRQTGVAEAFDRDVNSIAAVTILAPKLQVEACRALPHSMRSTQV